MLRRLYVHNYRTLVDFEWEPPPVCALVGDNGSGKSAIFEVLCLLVDVVAAGKRYEETGFPATVTGWALEKTQRIELELEIGGERYRYFVGYRLDGRRGTIEETLSAGGELLYRAQEGRVELFGDPTGATTRTTIPFDRRRSFLAVIEPRPDNQRIIAFRSALAAMSLIKPDPLRLGGPAGEEVAAPDRDLSNFASWYRLGVQQEPEATLRLREDLRAVLPGFVQLRLEALSPEVKDLKVRFEFDGRTHELSWSKLSDGQRLLVALYGALRLGLERASLIALDEIENYVAPAEIQPWLRAVVDLTAERGGQLIVISHHPESVDYLAADAVWRMSLGANGASRIVRLEPDRDAGERAYDLVRERQNDDD